MNLIVPNLNELVLVRVLVTQVRKLYGSVQWTEKGKHHVNTLFLITGIDSFFNSW